MTDTGTCRDCALKENCAEYKENKSQCEDYESYNEVMTNEEWFCQLPTTEKSEFLSTMVKEAIEVHEKHGTTWHEAVSWWDGWLKAKHE